MRNRRRATQLAASAGKLFGRYDNSRLSEVKGNFFLGVLALMTAFVLGACGGESEAEKHYNAGLQLQEEGREEEAIAEYDEVIRLDSQAAAAYHNRGLAYGRLDQYQRAIQDFSEAILINPQLQESYNNRGVAYGFVGDYERAVEDLSEAIRLDPEDGSSWGARAAAYILLGRDEEAQQDIETAVHLGLDSHIIEGLTELWAAAAAE